MPYKDPEKKKEAMKAWRERSIARGYGRYLYARRKLRFDDAERFRKALEEIAGLIPEGTTSVAVDIAQNALEASHQAEEALGPWEGGEDAT